MLVRSLGWEDPLEEGMATHSSILAWRIPWTEEPGGAIVHTVTKSQTRLRDSACTYWQTVTSFDPPSVLVHPVSRQGLTFLKEL